MFLTGNWDADTQEARYSAKVPLMALRVMAGFEKEDAYFLPRGRACPSVALCSKIWPWLDDAMADVRDDFDPHPTAWYFLSFMDLLRSIILQDAAAMIVKLRSAELGEQRRLNHAVFHIPVFQSAEFEAFVGEMAAVLERCEANDPNDVSIDRVLPGVNRRFDELARLMQELHMGVKGNKDGEERLEKLEKKMENLFSTAECDQAKRHDTTVRAFAGFLQQGADLFTRTITQPEEDQQAPSQEHQQGPSETQQSAVDGGPEGVMDVEVGDEHRETDEEILLRVMAEPQQPSFRHKNTKKILLQEMYMEYYGLGDYDGIPIAGGFHGLELKFKNSWRKESYKNSDSTFFSRWKALMSALATEAGVEEGVLNPALIEVANAWQPHLSIGGLAGCVSRLQKEGVVNKKGSRVRVENTAVAPLN